MQRNEVDVVVLDVKMPGMDGIEALREIKRRHPLTEVIMLTVHESILTDENLDIDGRHALTEQARGIVLEDFGYLPDFV